MEKVKKRRLKITPVLVTLNLLVLFLMIGYYSARLIIYYNKGRVSPDEKQTLADAIKQKQSFVDLTSGLVYDEETGVYVYKGNEKNNYLTYSGMLYRILSVDENNSIKAVTDNSATILYSGLEKGFNKSYIKRWLNIDEENKNSGIFEKTLYNSDSLLVNSTLCTDIINDLTKITCDKVSNTNKIVILSLSDYYNAGGKESFLNNGENFYLNTKNKEKAMYFITNEGEVGINNVDSKTYGVRPVITINANSILIKGTGKKSDPYVIEEHKVNTAKKLYVGDIIKISKNNYKVVSFDSNKVKVAMDGVIVKNNKDVSRSFGDNNTYSADNNIGEYLNEKYLNTIKEKDYIIKSKWYLGLPTLDDLNYENIYSDSISAKVGMLTLGDMFISDIKNTFTMFRSSDDEKIINVINKDNNLFGDFVTEKYNIRPAFYIKSSLEIKSGSGTKENPYVLGASNEKAKK